jgi:hypothetical protein
MEKQESASRTNRKGREVFVHIDVLYHYEEHVKLRKCVYQHHGFDVLLCLVGSSRYRPATLPTHTFHPGIFVLCLQSGQHTETSRPSSKQKGRTIAVKPRPCVDFFIQSPGRGACIMYSRSSQITDILSFEAATSRSMHHGSIVPTQSVIQALRNQLRLTK